jgi:galactokinase
MKRFISIFFQKFNISTKPWQFCRMETRQNIVSAFGERFGGRPDLLVSAPGRINLIGEHTDYNNGWVLPAAIDRAIYLAARPNSLMQLRCLAPDLGEYGEAGVEGLKGVFGARWMHYLLGIYAVLNLSGYRPGGLDVVLGGDIPVGAGLSSSAALEIGLLHALEAVYGLNIPPLEKVSLARQSENQFVGVQCGIMDMFAVEMSREGHALLLDCATLEYQYLPLPMAGHAFLLCDSGVRHRLADSAYNTRREECGASLRFLPGCASLRDATPALVEAAAMPEQLRRRARHVVTENVRVGQAVAALGAGNLPELGRLMQLSHTSLRDDYAVSCAELDTLAGAGAACAGVLGSRMMGGGFGGCTLNLIEASRADSIAAGLGEIYRDKHHRDLPCYLVFPSSGCRIIDVP